MQVGATFGGCEGFSLACHVSAHTSTMQSLGPWTLIFRCFVLQKHIEEGKRFAALLHARDSSDFNTPLNSVYGKVPVAKTREASWMRREVTKVVAGLLPRSAPLGLSPDSKVLIESELARRRTVDPTALAYNSAPPCRAASRFYL